MLPFAAIIISMYVTIILVPLLNRAAIRMNALDMPGERKVHLSPKARTGGIAMAVGILLPLVLWAPLSPFLNAAFIATGVLLVFGLVDDIRGVGFRTKFSGQIIAASAVIFYGGVHIQELGDFLPHGVLLPPWFSIPLTYIVIIGVTNAINLSDGLDGLAGGISLLSFVFLSYLAYNAGDMTSLLIGTSVIGAIFGFLRYNSYPSVIFMGDTGSQLLGFLVITLALKLTQGNTPVSPFLPLLIVGFPILDTVTVMVSRIRAGLSPFKADNRHFHHRLIAIGLFHSEAVLFIYILQSILVLSSFLFRFQSDYFLLCYYVVFSGMILGAFFFTRRYGWKLPRKNILDKKIKGPLRALKEIKLLIKVSFSSVKILFPVLLISSCFIPESIPTFVSTLSLVMLAVFVLTWKLRTTWIESVSAVFLYLAIPAIIYFSETNTAPWVTNTFKDLHLLLFGLLLVSSYLTLKFTRRREGFKANPMDFLVLLIVLIIPNLPDERIQSLHLGASAIKIIVLYLGFEVLIGELRKKTRLIGTVTVALLLLLAARGGW